MPLPMGISGLKEIIEQRKRSDESGSRKKADESEQQKKAKKQ
jgi:hypothetical protein